MAEIRDYENNPDPTSAARWPEGMAMSDVNDTGRIDEGIIARWEKDINTSLISGGTATAYTIVSPNRDLVTGQTTPFYEGLVIAFTPHVASGADPTLNVQATGAKQIVDVNGNNIPTGALPANSKVSVYYSSAYDAYMVSSYLPELASETAPGLVERATQTETDDGTDDERYITPLKAKSAIWTFDTGDIMPTARATARNGWLLCNGGTIGDTGSGASELADPSAQPLFTLLWDDWADAQAPVSGGRGASAAADWAAGKTIAIPDARQRTLVGIDSGTFATIGSTGGAETHTLIISEMPSHNHPYAGRFADNASTGAAVHGGPNRDFTPNTDSTGGDQPHNNLQPWLALNYMIKL